MDRKSILAILISLVIWVAWQKYYWEPYQKAQHEWAEYQEKLKHGAVTNDKKNESSAVSNVPALNTLLSAPSTKADLTLKNITFGDTEITFANGPELIHGWKMRTFKTSDENEEARKEINLKYVTGFDRQFRIGFSDKKFEELSAQNFLPASASGGQNYVDEISSKDVVVRRTVSSQSVAHSAKVNLQFHFKTEPPKYIFVELFGSPKRENDTAGSIFGQYPDKVEVAYFNREGRSAVVADKVKDRIETSVGAHWLGLNTRYFLFALLPGESLPATNLGIQVQPEMFENSNAVVGKIVIPTDGKTDLAVPLVAFFGPKQLDVLTSVSPTLTNAIDFGWTSALAIPLLRMLKFVYSIVGNYGVAIVLVTLFIKIILFPLSYKGMKSMAKMQRLKPQLERLQKKYAEDKQKLQQETWNLYKSNGANPLSGCLPLILQMPVFFALYRVFFNCMELYQAPGLLWIRDLSAKDPIFVMPLMLMGLMFLQQKLVPTTGGDPSQQAVMKVMPIMFGAFMLFLPAGLNIYMIVNTIFSIVQQYALNRKFGLHAPIATTETTKAVSEIS